MKPILAFFKKNKKTLITLSVFIGLSVLIVAGAFYIKSTQKPASKVSYSKVIQSNIKSTFNKPSQKQIITNLNLGLSKNYHEDRWPYLYKAYQAMFQEYNKTKDPKYKESLIKYQAYLSVYPEFDPNKMGAPPK